LWVLLAVVLGDGDRLELSRVLMLPLSERWKVVIVVAIAESPTALLTYRVDEVLGVVVVIDDLS
jgi:hypothetical protein